ncbi:MAG: NAD(P)/FAD-dependent oxidoreductase [bacterium]|nr:NAD(P)/FAD-dependent oxidoreductase [bacterium]
MQNEFKESDTSYEVAVIGGGPAGLSAALVLGRTRRRTVVLNYGAPRNAPARNVHGFLTRDGTPPAEMRAIAREQISSYDSVSFHDARITAIESAGESGFLIRTPDGTLHARIVLLATGVIDRLPDLPGLAPLWESGASIFLCPFCHGWEVRDRPWALLAENPADVEWSLLLKSWSDDLIVFTNGAFEVPDDLQAKIGRAKILLEERPLRKLIASDTSSDTDIDAGQDSRKDNADTTLQAIELADGEQILREVLFVRTSQRQTDLVQSLELSLTDIGFVAVDAAMQTNLPGVYAAGDLTTPMQQALSAASDGARAAAMIHHRLSLE